MTLDIGEKVKIAGSKHGRRSKSQSESWHPVGTTRRPDRSDCRKDNPGLCSGRDRDIDFICNAHLTRSSNKIQCPNFLLPTSNFILGSSPILYVRFGSFTNGTAKDCHNPDALNIIYCVTSDALGMSSQSGRSFSCIFFSHSVSP